ncbi:hypothetical protein AVEN_56866-1, partial [Araneus ventricosus]
SGVLIVMSGLRDPRVSNSKPEDTKYVPNVWIWYTLSWKWMIKRPSRGVMWKFSEGGVCSYVTLVIW